jgi:hypothetical protein
MNNTTETLVPLIRVKSYLGSDIFLNPSTETYTATTAAGRVLEAGELRTLKAKLEDADARAAAGKRVRPSIPVRVVDINTGDVLQGTWKGANLHTNEYEVLVGDAKRDASNVRFAHVDVDTETLTALVKKFNEAKKVAAEAFDAIEKATYTRRGWPYIGHVTAETVAKADLEATEALKKAGVIA